MRFPVEHPDEMGSSLENAVDRFSRHESYVRAFAAGVSAPTRDHRRATIAQALAAYERTLVSPPTRFDDGSPATPARCPPSEVSGFAHLHRQGPLQQLPHRLCLHRPRLLRHRPAGRGSRAAAPIIGLAAADHAFKTPTLRELAWTAPYMHDGSLATLEDVVRHYEMGGVARPTRSRDLPQNLRLTDRSAPTSIAFLETLSSETPPQPSQRALGGNAEPPPPRRRPPTPTVVSQVNKLFAPAHVRLKAGQTLTVLNDDTRTHNVRIYDPRFDYNSGAQEPHETVTHPLSRRAARSRPSAASTPPCA